MDETLGRRIVSNRKRLGITQDRLAEQLGVTAQAVSKWENDQSCPDITMLPKLAEIFGISTDVLLGVVQQNPEPESAEEVGIADFVEADENEDFHIQKGNWELHWDGGRKSYLGLAVWIILTAGAMFAATYCHTDADFWDLLWTSGLLVFGAFGLFHRFSFIRLGCALFGAHSLLKELDMLPGYFGKDLLLPAFLLLFGLGLLVYAFRRPHRPLFSVIHNGKQLSKSTSNRHIGIDTFDISCSFSEKDEVIDLAALRRGNAEVSFGSMTLDLTAVKTFAADCRLDANCNFGELTVLIPGHIRADVDQNVAFGSVNIRGNHNAETTASVHIDADVSFGEIVIRYI